MARRALQFLTDALQGLHPNEIAYRMVSVQAENGRVAKEALQLFVEMQLQGLRPNVITYTAVISACEEGWMAR